MPRVLQTCHGHLAPSQSSGYIPICRMGAGSGLQQRGQRGSPALNPHSVYTWGYTAQGGRLLGPCLPLEWVVIEVS